MNAATPQGTPQRRINNEIHHNLIAPACFREALMLGILIKKMIVFSRIHEFSKYNIHLYYDGSAI